MRLITSQAPAEAESLLAARSAWSAAAVSTAAEAAGASTPGPAAPGFPAQRTPPTPSAAFLRRVPAASPESPPRPLGSDSAADSAAAASISAEAPASASAVPWARGPLIIFPDTSAALAMAGASNARPTPLSFQRLEELASARLFGRGLPAAEQTFVVVSDSVAKQLDGLKSNPARSSPRCVAAALREVHPPSHRSLWPLRELLSHLLHSLRRARLRCGGSSPTRSTPAGQLDSISCRSSARTRGRAWYGTGGRRLRRRRESGCSAGGASWYAAN